MKWAFIREPLTSFPPLHTLSYTHSHTHTVTHTHSCRLATCQSQVAKPPETNAPKSITVPQNTLQQEVSLSTLVNDAMMRRFGIQDPERERFEFEFEFRQTEMVSCGPSLCGPPTHYIPPPALAPCLANIKKVNKALSQCATLSDTVACS